MERPLTAHLDPDREPLDLAGYEAAGGYQSVKKALREMTPAEVRDAVSNSALKGRGGAGFPTGKKWSFVPCGDGAPHPKYFVLNADEMEPGTFKDRLLLERGPHLVIESCIVCAYAIEADAAYIFLRWAYRTAEHRLRRAIAEAREAGYLGRDLLGTGYDLELRVHVSAGRYMCGEETGLLNALEGRRATPRAKPPYPQVSGLWGQPTIVNNVETACNVPGIVNRGPDWFKGLSRCDDGGTKLFGVSGNVVRPGLWELPMGTTLGELLEEHAGGMRGDRELRALLPGGASTDFLGPEHLDVPMAYDALVEAGSRFGTGTVVVVDDQTCPVRVLYSLEAFFARESCGWCTPCREGLPWTARLLAAIEAGHGELPDLDRLADHARLLGPGHTFCALAPGAAAPLGSGLERFRDDLRRHIVDGRCPYHGRHA